MAQSDLGNGSNRGWLRVSGEHWHAFEFAREAVLTGILAGGLRLLRIEERSDGRRRRLGRLERQGHRGARELRGVLRTRCREGAGPCAGQRRRPVMAQPLAFRCEPAPERPNDRPGAQIRGQDQAEEGDHDQRGSRTGAAENSFDARTD
jgi:hypothetical protein